MRKKSFVAALGGVFLMASSCGGNTTAQGPGGAGGGGSGGSGAVGGAGALGGTGGSSGGLPEKYFACADTSECVVRMATCCELCGPGSASEAIAHNRQYADPVSAELCKNQTDPCPVADCVIRPSYVLPFCIEGRCQAIDIREDLMTSCGTDEQCRLRWDARCCEACGGISELLIAVNSQVNYEATVCGRERVCPKCAISEYPPDAKAVCNASHHCEVARP